MRAPGIRAAGGVVVGDDGRVAIVHRARHGDWSLPKGKLDEGEAWEAAALREIEEECGVRCVLQDELPTTRYRVGDRRKTVRWWRMRPVVAHGAGSTDGEVDELRWATPEEARALLTYPADRQTLAAALEG